MTATPSPAATADGIVAGGVRQALVVAVQDATAALRHATSIATAASAAGLARFLATGDRSYLAATADGQDLVRAALDHLRSVIALADRHAAVSEERDEETGVGDE